MMVNNNKNSDVSEVVFRQYRTRALCQTVLITAGALFTATLIALLFILVTKERNWLSAITLMILIVVTLVPIPSYFWIQRFNLLKKKHHALDQAARQDSLTGAFNRQYVLAMLERELSLCQRHQYDVSIIVLDIADYSTLQMRYGRQIGEYVLSSFAQNVKRKIRDSDIFGHLEGSQFLLVLPHTSYDNTLQMLKAKTSITTSFDLDINADTITVQPLIGIASTENTGPDVTTLLNSADYSLYKDRKNQS